MSILNRVHAGVPTGGQFAAGAHSESETSLEPAQTARQVDDAVVVGQHPEPIAVAQARREMPVDARVQVVYLNGQGRNQPAGPDIRTVTKQIPSEMITAGPPGSRAEHGSHLGWTKTRAQRDTAGNIIVSHADGTPIVAYLPLSDESAGFAQPQVQVQAADDIYAARTASDPSELYGLAGSDLAVVRRYVAANSQTDEKALILLCQDDDAEVVQAVMDNPRAPWQAVAAGADSVDEDVRVRACKHRNLRPRTAGELAEDPSIRVRSLIASNPVTPPWALHAMLEREGTYSGLANNMAANPSMPPEDLVRLSRGTGFAMSAVAGNPSASAYVLTRLSHDTSTGNQTRAMVARNPSAPEPVMRKLAGDEDEWVREHAAKNPSMPPERLDALVRDGQSRVRRACAGNPGTSRVALSLLCTDLDDSVRAAAAKNPNALPEDLRRMSMDTSPRVRSSVAQNPSTSTQLLRSLAAEKGVVGQWASRCMETRQDEA